MTLLFFVHDDEEDDWDGKDDVDNDDDENNDGDFNELHLRQSLPWMHVAEDVEEHHQLVSQLPERSGTGSDAGRTRAAW